MRLLMCVPLVTMLIAGPSRGSAQEVFRAPSNLTSLVERWDWGVREAKSRGLTNGVWIVYSIDRLMHENSWIGTFRSIPDPNEATLYELVTGRRIEFEEKPYPDLRDAARKALSRAERKELETKVLKEIVFLFEFRGDPSDPETMRTIKVSNITLTVDLDNLSLIWLGKSNVKESVDFLKQIFGSVSSRRSSEKIIHAVGLHGNVPGVFEFLEGILTSSERSSLREESAFWLGRLDTTATLRLLTEAALKDGSRAVSEKAIFAISQMSTEEATETLIHLGRNAPEKGVRKKAVFWLGHRASKKVVETLREFVNNDRDEEIQKHAVFALTQLPNNEGVSDIIHIAKTHPNPRIRKQAVFWLGECDDPRAFDTIVEIARGK